jgi:hypothetical protein
MSRIHFQHPLSNSPRSATCSGAIVLLRTPRSATVLRHYIFDGEPAAADVFLAVSQLLYASGTIDKTGLEDVWLASASEAEPAVIFTRIMTGRWS